MPTLPDRNHFKKVAPYLSLALIGLMVASTLVVSIIVSNKDFILDIREKAYLIEDSMFTGINPEREKLFQETKEKKEKEKKFNV